MSYEGPAIDHSILSPNGRVSRRARDTALARDQARVQQWFDAKYPVPTADEVERKRMVERIGTLRRSAANLRELASRGMHPVSYPRKAAVLEAEAAKIESTLEGNPK